MFLLIISVYFLCIIVVEKIQVEFDRKVVFFFKFPPTKHLGKTTEAPDHHYRFNHLLPPAHNFLSLNSILSLLFAVSAHYKLKIW